MRNRTEIVSAVLARAERQSADAALREVLREARISPEEKRAVSKSAFAYFRWRGWLDRNKSIRQQIELAAALGEQFEADPKSISDSELLANAVPEWVGEIMRITPELLREFQKEPRLWFRARPGTGKDLARALGSSAIHSLVADAIWYEGEEDLYRTKEFHAGAFEIQDLSSQIVGHLCDPAAGQTWWDACAGEGGKTLHLCDLMRNKGLVWASDPAMWRLDILKRRAARAGLFNYRIKAWSKSQALPTKTKFDGVLVDAPCSGIGTWGKNPHARWTTTRSDVEELAQVQRDILARVANSVKPGGKLIYSVCTLPGAETEEVMRWFSASYPQFKALDVASPMPPSQRKSVFELLPQGVHANGMYIALWRRD